jgi:hypothetical protein
LNNAWRRGTHCVIVFAIFLFLKHLKKSISGGNKPLGVHIIYTGTIGRIGRILGNF